MNTLKSVMLLGLLSGLLVILGGALGGQSGAILGLVIAGVMNFASYWWSDKMVLKMYNAQEISSQDDPELYGDIQELAQNAGLPMPRVYMIPEQAPNAFATGRDPEHAVVAVTEGIRRLLSREELKGVLGHELTHIKRRDILIGTIAATIAGAITYIAYMAQFAAMFGGFGGGDRRGSNPIALIAMAILAPIAAGMIRMAISRTREYGADRGGAEICGNPMYLADALRKMANYSGRARMSVSQRTAESTAHMMIISPMLGGGLSKLFSTHPPIEERIARLEEMAIGRS